MVESLTNGRVELIRFEFFKAQIFPAERTLTKHADKPIKRPSLENTS